MGRLGTRPTSRHGDGAWVIGHHFGAAAARPGESGRTGPPCVAIAVKVDETSAGAPTADFPCLARTRTGLELGTEAEVGVPTAIGRPTIQIVIRREAASALIMLHLGGKRRGRQGTTGPKRVLALATVEQIPSPSTGIFLGTTRY